MLLGLAAGISACTTGSRQNMAQERNRYEFSNILNIALTPDSTVHRAGCFTDAGSWMGFTIPQQDKWVNGFCGPFSIDNRIWFAQSIVEASLIGETTAMTPDSASYFPGEVYISSSSGTESISQRMNFINASTALLQIESNSGKGLCFTARQWNNNIHLEAERNIVTARHSNGEIVTLTFDSDITLTCDGKIMLHRLNPDARKLILPFRSSLPKRTSSKRTTHTSSAEQSFTRAEGKCRPMERILTKDSTQRHEA